MLNLVGLGMSNQIFAFSVEWGFLYFWFLINVKTSRLSVFVGVCGWLGWEMLLYACPIMGFRAKAPTLL